MVQDLPWGSQIAVKKRSVYLDQCKVLPENIETNVNEQSEI